jgi:cell division protein FtsL
VNQAREIRELRQKRDALRAERIRLDSAIREASSRARIVPIAEQRLNMHIAPPDQQVFLPRPQPSVRPKHDSL